jgi:alkanesulfonate monooxygenase SsuD/methylene tetrahydromethanopterin reductase-like flavin-dependent oxidoreductase (luciferase family)
MQDYGHELAFGTFLTPRSRRPGDVVALAQLTERAGFDLVSVQDHPYESAFVDAWTLLSWICYPAGGSSSGSGRARSGTGSRR